MPSQQESNNALVLTDVFIIHWEGDGRELIDEAHEIVRHVSQGLQQHGWTCSVISPFVLSAAAKVQATMNQGLVPQWHCVWADDPRMESHPFFPKTVGYKQPVPAPAPAPVLAPAPTPASAPVLAPAPAKLQAHSPVASPAPTQISREDSTDVESGWKKLKVSKHLSKAVISDTEDKDRQPTGTIIVKWPKNVEPSPAALPKAKGNMKSVKQPHGKGNKKVVDIAEPTRGRGPLKANTDEMHWQALSCGGQQGSGWVLETWIGHPKVRMRRGNIIGCRSGIRDMTPVPSATSRSVGRFLGPINNAGDKVTPSSVKGRTHIQIQGSILDNQSNLAESKDAVEDMDESATSSNDADMEPDTDTEWQLNITTEMSVDPEDEIMADQPADMASAANFPAKHWLEPTEEVPVTIPPPTPAANPLSLSSSPSSPTILKCLLALTTQMNAMQLANEHALARVNAMEQEFDARISSMHAELSSMQLDVGATVTLVNGLVGLVKKLQQEQVVANPSFPPPALSHANESSATTFGMRYLNGVFGPSVAPMPLSVGVGQSSALHPSSHPEVQGGTSTYE
ncbi:hypothetical protein BDR06DRAFT_1036812 [Suillus hirtellus]|nr:hypothetical protein BDR06DRAFT_1036812 [Suillus hirtellus]